METASQDGRPATGTRVEGSCIVLFAFDIGFQIDLETAQALLNDSAPYRAVRGRRPAPVWFDYQPPPIRLFVDADPVDVGAVSMDRSIELLIYDFGAALVTYRAPLAHDLAELPGLAALLNENESLLDHARRQIERAMDVMRPAIERPRLRDLVDDYLVFAVTDAASDLPPAAFLDANAETVARAIEAETGPLAPEQAARTLEGRMSYAPDDLAVVDWNGAILIDKDPDDVIAVLQHANVELLELRVLDSELDEILDHADETLLRMTKRRVWPSFRTNRLLTRFASAQTDAAVMFEGVNNAIKLLGNQYLARLYRMTATRLDLPSWQASVQRKLAATESVYQKISDTAGTRRMETLEVIIILLIAISLILPFLPIGYAH